MKNVAIYARVSTDDQSCDRQLRDLTAYAERLGLHIVAAFQEKESGVKTDRKERAKVMALAQARKIDAVLVTELTRWGRSTLDLLETLKDLNAYNCSIIAETGMQFDLSTAQGKMIAGVMAALAEFERDLIAERTKSGLAAARARGAAIGRPKGDKTTGKHQKAVETLLEQGFSYREIASKLKIGKATVAKCKEAIGAKG